MILPRVCNQINSVPELLNFTQGLASAFRKMLNSNLYKDNQGNILEKIILKS